MSPNSADTSRTAAAILDGVMIGVAAGRSKQQHTVACLTTALLYIMLGANLLRMRIYNHAIKSRGPDGKNIARETTSHDVRIYMYTIIV